MVVILGVEQGDEIAGWEMGEEEKEIVCGDSWKGCINK